ECIPIYLAPPVGLGRPESSWSDKPASAHIDKRSPLLVFLREFKPAPASAAELSWMPRNWCSNNKHSTSRPVHRRVLDSSQSRATLPSQRLRELGGGTSQLTLRHGLGTQPRRTTQLV